MTPMRVIVNPGHKPGADPGAIGPTGLTEAEVALHIAHALLSLQDSDGLVRYEGRTQRGRSSTLATVCRSLREHPPDILLSIHCNAADTNKCIHRADTIWWREDPDEERRRHSQRLAIVLARSAVKANGIGYAADATAKTAPYSRRKADGSAVEFTPGILRETARVAAVLIEVGFISDAHVEAAMRTVPWVRSCAAAIDRAVREFVGELAEVSEARSPRDGRRRRCW